ncbi:MAG: hypothetical protein JSW17_01340, partial [Candidatus Omnitrophota bacterium]
MIIHVLKTKRCSSCQGIVLFILNAFIITTIFSSFPVNAYSLTELSLPKPTQLISTSPMLDAPCLQGIKFYFNQPFRFDFIIDEGQKRVEPEELRVEASRLIKYFLASLTIPEDDLWVNLSPYERDVIIPDELGHTVLGEDLLGEDYILKQLMASLTYPENPLGKKFWEKVYQKAYEIYGTTEIPINTFNKIWIVPDKAVVYEEGDRAVIGEARLKVMMEEDYLALRRNLGKPDIVAHRLEEGQVKEISNFSSTIMKEVVLPIVEGEVNHGKNFAYLRQIYNSLILAVWFKNKLRESILGQIYVDQKKIGGVNAKERRAKEKVYTRYLAAYERGAYNYIRTDYDTSLKRNIQRRYFSGGVDLSGLAEELAKNTFLGIPKATIERMALSPVSTTEIRLVPAVPERGPTVFARARSLIGRLFRGVTEERVEEKERPVTVSSPVEVAKVIDEVFGQGSSQGLGVTQLERFRRIYDSIDPLWESTPELLQKKFEDGQINIGLDGGAQRLLERREGKTLESLKQRLSFEVERTFDEKAKDKLTQLLSSTAQRNNGAGLFDTVENLQMISHGAQGVVFLGDVMLDGRKKEVIIKVAKTGVEGISREVYMHSSLQQDYYRDPQKIPSHGGIPRIFGVENISINRVRQSISEDVLRAHGLSSRESVYVSFIEAIPGAIDLKKAVSEQRDIKREAVDELTEVVGRIHELGYAHNDLTSANSKVELSDKNVNERNVLIDSSGNLWLIDFGLTRNLEELSQERLQNRQQRDMLALRGYIIPQFVSKLPIRGVPLEVAEVAEEARRLRAAAAPAERAVGPAPAVVREVTEAERIVREKLPVAKAEKEPGVASSAVEEEAERVKRVAGVEELKAKTPAVFITEAEEEVVEPAALAVAEEAEWRK